MIEVTRITVPPGYDLGSIVIPAGTLLSGASDAGPEFFIVFSDDTRTKLTVRVKAGRREISMDEYFASGRRSVPPSNLNKITQRIDFLYGVGSP